MYYTEHYTLINEDNCYVINTFLEGNTAHAWSFDFHKKNDGNLVKEAMVSSLFQEYEFVYTVEFYHLYSLIPIICSQQCFCVHCYCLLFLPPIIPILKLRLKLPNTNNLLSTMLLCTLLLPTVFAPNHSHSQVETETE